MTNLYLDHDISAYMVVPLRGRGHMVVTTDELGHSSASNDDLLLEAARMSHVFITHNLRDFALLRSIAHGTAGVVSGASRDRTQAFSSYRNRRASRFLTQ